MFSSNQGRTPECKRHLETMLTEHDDPNQIARELANYAFISVNDVDVMTRVIQVTTCTDVFLQNLFFLWGVSGAL